MCGIIAAFKTGKKKKPVNSFIINQFQDQISRGKEGFGIIRINQKSFEIDRATEPCKFLLDLYQNPSAMIIAHHRMPTSTANKLSQTHPILVSNSLLTHDYLIVHNGVIYNDEEIKKEHEKLDFKYQTEIETTSNYGEYYYRRQNFNDSEVMAIEMALFIEGKIKGIRTRGSQAFIALQIEKKSQKPALVFFGRKDNPLKMLREKNTLSLSSEGLGNQIEESVLYSFKVNDTKMKLQERKIEFFTPKEQKLEKEETPKEEKTNNKVKIVVYNEMEEYFKESLKGKTIEEIEEMTEETLEMCEIEIAETTADMRNRLLTETQEVKTGEYKKLICLKLDEIKRIITIAQAETALTETKEEKIAEKEYIHWRKGNYWNQEDYMDAQEKEEMGQRKLRQMGF